MDNIGLSAVYNSRIPYMSHTRSRSLRTVCSALFISIFCHVLALAGDWDATEQQLAAKIVSITGSGPATVEVSNRSSLSQTEVEAIRRGLLDHLSAVGLKWSNPDSVSVTIQISLSENVQEYVWVATVRKASNELSVVMVSRPFSGGTVHELPAYTIRKTLLWSSDTQILDAIVINGALPRMAVLYPGQIQFYRLQGDHWVDDQAFPVTHSHPWPRDLRGRLILRRDRSIEVHLPGVACQNNAGNPPSMSCREDDDPWPVGTEQSPMNAFFAQTRNFFTGVLSPGIGKQANVPAFFSVAPAANDRGTSWVVAGLDGHAHLLDGISDVTLKVNWGSDIAGMHSSCGSRWQLLATNSENGQDDTVRAYEMTGHEAVATGQALSFPGRITSLWTAPDENGAVAVAHNTETGKYEAYLLTMACSQ